jgi:hypothetical protein
LDKRKQSKRPQERVTVMDRELRSAVQSGKPVQIIDNKDAPREVRVKFVDPYFIKVVEADGHPYWLNKSFCKEVEIMNGGGQP